MLNAYIIGVIQFLLILAALFIAPTPKVEADDSTTDSLQSIREEFRFNYDDITRNYLEPVLSALRLDAKNDQYLLHLLEQVHLRTSGGSSGTGNARTYLADVRSRVLEVDATLISAVITSGILSVSPSEAQIDFIYKYSFNVGRSLSQGEILPPFVIHIDQYVTDPIKNRSLKSMAQTVYEPAIAWVVLHEIAHHVLGHLDTSPKSLLESRAQEEQADLWAARKLKTLEYPLLGVAKYMTWMALIERNIYKLEKKLSYEGELRESDIQKLELNSTHPSWHSRHKTLLENFDVMAMPEVTFLNYRIIDEIRWKDNSKTPIDFSITFPNRKRANQWGTSYLHFSIINSGGDAWINYTDDSAIFYYRSEKDRMEIKLANPGARSTEIQIEFFDNKNNRLFEIKTFGWFDSFAKHYALPEFGGRAFKDILELTPYSIQNTVLSKLEKFPHELDQVRRQIYSCQAKDNQTLLEFHAGRLSVDEFDDKFRKGQQICLEVVKAILGESRHDEYKALLLEDPFFAKSLSWAIGKVRNAAP